MSFPDDKTDAAIVCIATKPGITITSFGAFVKALLGDAPTLHCGAPATKDTIMGPMCQECFDRVDKLRRERKNLLGVLEEELPKLRQALDPERTGK